MSVGVAFAVGALSGVTVMVWAALVGRALRRRRYRRAARRANRPLMDPRDER